VRDGQVLVMRNMFETIELRLVAIEEMALRQFLVVRAGNRRWVSTVVGRSLRKSMSSSRKPAPALAPTGDAAAPVPKVAYADFVEERLRRLIDDAQEVAAVRPGSPEQLALPDAVRRERAWLPLGLVVAAALALVVTLLL
jgi:hypothetical protein